MSEITVRQVFKVSGTPTDVTSFVLSNEAATAGIVRNDTSAIVVAAGQAMTRVALGTYEYTFTAPASGLTYTAYYKITAVDGSVFNLQDTITDTTSGEAIPLPALTGDTLTDTLNSLLVQRLQVIRDGVKISYSLHGHSVSWNEYLRDLDQRIMALRKEIAQVNPIEEISVGF